MASRRFLVGSALVASLLLALGCGSSVDAPGVGGADGRGGGGGEGAPAPGAGGAADGGGEGGFAPDCESYDFDCYCDACEAAGKLCTNVCNNPPSAECVAPAVPGEGEFSCGGVISCGEGEICLEVSPFTDGCSSFQCREPPVACLEALDCGCLEANLVEEAEINCTEQGGNLTVSAVDLHGIPPWTDEACGGAACAADEECYGCVPGGGTGNEPPSHVCLSEAPSGPGSCAPR